MSEDHKPRQMVIEQTEVWSAERIKQIAKDVAGRAMSVESATIMMAAHMQELYAYHQGCVDSLRSEVDRLMSRVKELEAK